MSDSNPFALVRAANYSDAQINNLWVEMGAAVINAVIEPKARDSKYILGGKGTGKTHLLRYHSYQVMRLRHPELDGLKCVVRAKYLAVFIRAAGVDPGRFENAGGTDSKWQQLFGVYLELRLVEVVLEALREIANSSPQDEFDDASFIRKLARSINDPDMRACQSIEELYKWVEGQRLQIDDAVNNVAFTGELNLRIPFSIGSFCIPIGSALREWNSQFSDVPLIYLVDEIENFTAVQQEVLNTLVRYGEGFTTFRMTGRLYSRKSFATLADGEENREGAEFRTSNLDDILRRYRKYPDFARRFVVKRLAAAGLVESVGTAIDPRPLFEEVTSSDFFIECLKAKHTGPVPQFLKDFREALMGADTKWKIDSEEVEELVSTLVEGFPLLIQRLNVLLFCKRLRVRTHHAKVTEAIRAEARKFVEGESRSVESYSIAYGHYHLDLFAQLCRESRRLERPLYGGFESFVKMSSGNARNLLVLLGRVYEIAAFKEIDFISGPRLSVALQTQAAGEAARFMFERDANFGSKSELAKQSVTRLAELLRTARFALNIPEVSPLAVSFSAADLSEEASVTLNHALNYSFVFEVQDGRPDRNSEALHRKIQLSPILSPRWGLGIVRGGDIRLNRELLNSIFDLKLRDEFEGMLRILKAKWNSPFKATDGQTSQAGLF